VTALRRLFLAFLGLTSLATALGGAFDPFVQHAKTAYGDFGERAAMYLIRYMPAADQTSLTSEYLIENLDLAMHARTNFPWARSVPEELFFNDVLPYAVFDETREPWRADLLAKSRELVRDAKTATEATQALNRQLFKLINVHYNTGRKRPNQSLSESVKQGRATCTGLSIILAQACRSVGIPARAVGTPLWVNERGNHTWTEIWDQQWLFTGADEYDAAGLNRGWFVGDASQARADIPRYSIYATSWKPGGVSFPMVWNRTSTTVAAVNVTDRYAKPAAGAAAPASHLGVRLFAKPRGERLVAKVQIIDAGGHIFADSETKAGRADLNDMPRFDLTPGSRGWVRLTLGKETREVPFGPLPAGDVTLDAVWTTATKVPSLIYQLEAWLAMPAGTRPTNAPVLSAPLTAELAARVTSILTADRLQRLAVERRAEFDAKTITLDGKSLRWKSRTYGTAPTNGHSLWISMHGGGGAPAAVNDQQWENQIKLYEPAEGIYVAPRAPTDTWNLWHEGHIDPMFQRLIDDHVALLGVNPDRVYIMGYSAGGDGVWQLAPRMADRFAAAAMMAGHPNEASMLGLRNLPFALFMGGNDSAYNRNRIARERSVELDQLAAADPGGYIHMARIYEGLGHWMNRKDAEAVPWMAGFTRKAWPGKIVWLQDDVLATRFYWLQVADKSAVHEKQKVVATLDQRTIRIEGEVPAGLSLRVSDALLNLDQSITVVVNGKKVFSGKPVRQAANILSSLQERADASTAASAVIRWN
jgi:poly(3-hydroxybutyrate) depolymerase